MLTLEEQHRTVAIIAERTVTTGVFLRAKDIATNSVRVIQYLLILILVFSAPVYAELSVKRVIDGDTVELNDGRKVRLIGVDCPEFRDRDRNERNALELGIDVDHYSSFAQKSSDFLRDLVSGREIRTEIDPVNAKINHHDRYARFLAYLYADDVLVNSALIKQGQCVTYRKFMFRFKDDFTAHEEDAKENNKGMWG